MAPLSLRLDTPLRSFPLAVELSAEAETLALAGPSGAGKTTVLRMLAGLLRPQHGFVAAGEAVWLDTARGIDLPPERRSVGLVPQDYALFPHMTVAQNVGFADPAAATGLLERFGLAGLARERPGRLSGGERQRVALARALARRPAVLALDEPLAALDAQTRRTVRDELAATLAGLGVPALLVTHDFADASALAARVAVLVDGAIRQVGTPAELLAEPADAFVAAFTGANVVRAEGRTVAFQPWDVRLVGEDGERRVVTAVERLGPRARVVLGDVVAEVAAEDAPRVGEQVGYAVAPECLRVVG
jgi:ABC-type sulfate/molybdate transport systems ATPase subunit